MVNIYTNARGIGKSIYPIRLLGYCFGALVLLLYRIQIDNVSIESLCLFIIFLLYPHLAFYRYYAKKSSSKVEIQNLCIDGALIGAFAVLMHFSLLPVVSFFVVVSATSMGVKGPKLFAAFCTFFVISIVVLGALVGFFYDASPSLEVQLLSITFLIAGSVSHNFIDFKRSIEFIAAKRQIQSQREQIAQDLHEKEVLLKEVHHRVKNNLQVIMSLLNLQLDTTAHQEVQEALQACKGRVYSMAAVHESLYQHESLRVIELKTFVPNLCEQLSKLYEKKEQVISFVHEIAPVQVPLKQAISIGLILNELVSNACKHAFENRASGKVTVKIKSVANNKSKQFEIQVSDDGIGDEFSLLDEHQSMGLSIVEDMVAQLNGQWTFNSNTGVTHSIIVDAL
jgi:two-component sensor histidine kinase